MKILIVGPNPMRTKGGMATVMRDIVEDHFLKQNNTIGVYSTYIDGSIIKKVCYSLFRYLFFLITQNKYEVYHVHMASKGSTFRKGIYIKTIKKWNKKIIIHLHGGGFVEFYKRSSEKNKKKIMQILGDADVIIALSETWRKQYEETFGKYNYLVIENGVDNCMFKSAVTEPNLNKYSFLFLGRMCEKKGIYDLINAIEIAYKSVPKIHFFFAGDGDLEQIARTIQDKELQNAITVVGWADNEKKLELLKQVSTVVLPSHYEALPMSVLEGMACGKAIIASKVGAIPEVVTDENGILIGAGDVVALSNAIVEMTRNEHKLIEYSKNNMRKIEEKFSMKAMHEKLQECYSCLAD